MDEIKITQRFQELTLTPQALAWNGRELWVSSRDLGTFQRVDLESRKMAEELDPPGVVWSAVAINDGWRLTIGKGLNDDRYIYSYTIAEGFRKLYPCPDFTGSYLGFDGTHLYLSQWYKGVILQLDPSGNTMREIAIGAEICGYTFVEGIIYVLRGRENKEVPGQAEEWRLARLDPADAMPVVQDLATIPFAARSLTFDGENFWLNHRAANETVSFALPT